MSAVTRRAPTVTTQQLDSRQCTIISRRIGGDTDLNGAATTAKPMAKANAKSVRTTVFISKATSGDDEFVLWLAPKLEAAGYTVFTDILTLEPGDRWRSVITSTLQQDAIKMLLCCRDSTLAAGEVLNLLGI
jgi:TIR domain